MFTRIDHVGIAVAQIDESIALFKDTLGIEVSHREVVSDQGVEAALLDVGSNHVELIAALNDQSTVAKFIAKRGPGLHHIAYQVTDIDATLAALKGLGTVLIDQQPRTGIRSSRVAFLHPRSTGGVLTEIVEPNHVVEAS